MHRSARILPIAASFCAVSLLLVTVSTAADKLPMPGVDEIESLTENYFASQPNFRPGEIISRSQVRGLFEELWRRGWKVPRQDELLRRVPDDSELLVRELRTKDGRKFSQQIARYPLSFDKLDRMSRMPTGKSILHRLVRGPDGYKLLQYMAEAPGGNELGKMLGGTPTGRDFNKPTGRIYTVSNLLPELRTRHEESIMAIRRSQAKVWGLKTPRQ
ncbi:MAG TPA: hypothetical protein VGG64_21885 [Pirellulales bacterium]|jgi:hypothetical protein